MASSLLIPSLAPGLQHLRILGALIAVAVMGGAVSFDLFPPVAGPEPPIYTSAFDDIAVQGYDPLACFKAGKPVKGTKEFPTTRNGAEFRFASAANRDAFRKYPDAYAPQYRGCCAWTVSQGYTSKGDAKFCKNRR